MADVSNAVKTINSHPLEATYFNGKSYDEMVAIDLTSGDIRNVFKTGLYRTCLERDGTTTLKSSCYATGSYSYAADVIVSVQQISDNSAIHVMTDSGYLYFRTVNGTSTDYYWEPYSRLGGGGGSESVTEYTNSVFLLYDDVKPEDERWANGAYKFTSTSTQTIKVFGPDTGYAVKRDRNNSSNPTTVYFTRIKSGGCRFYYTYLNNTDDKVHIVVGAAYETMSGMASYSDTVLGGSSSGGTTYTFAEGSMNGAFEVTPSGGSAQSVKVHGLKAAAYKNVSTSAASIYTNSDTIVTGGAIHSYLTSYVDITSLQNISGTKNFTGTLQYGGTDVAKYFEYKKLSTTKTYTATASGTISIKTSDIVPSADYVANATYEIYGQILAYSSSTGKVFLYSNKWGDNNSTDYYIINTTANARVGSTAFIIPCSGTLTCYKNINFSEFSLRIYGYRRISQ